MYKTKIDYATHTWNPVWGCRRGCDYCYARKVAQRFNPDDDFEPRWMENNFNRAMPRDPARIFVNSMSDIAYWTAEWFSKVIERISENPHHTFLFLTKYPAVYATKAWPRNCWLGATATNQDDADMFQHYLPSSRVSFLSIEPILGEIDPSIIKPDLVDWVILGAETGHRPDRVVPPPEWISPWLNLQIPLFMKPNLPWSGPEWREDYPICDNR